MTTAKVMCPSNRVSVSIFEIQEEFQKAFWTYPFVGGTLKQKGEQSACEDLVRELDQIRKYTDLKAQRRQLREMIHCYSGGLVVEEGDGKGKAKYDYLVAACKRLRKINWFIQYL